MKKIIFATGNSDKLHEIRMILDELGIEVVSGSLTVKLYQKYLQTASGLDFFCQFLCFIL